MADPLSIAASTVALATVVAQVSKVALVVAWDVKSTPTELSALSTELNAIRYILGRISDFYSPGHGSCPEDGANPEDVSKGCADLQHGLVSLESVLKMAEAKLAAVESLFRGSRLDRMRFALTWSYAKRDLVGLRAALESCKTSLLLSLQLMNL